MDEQFTQKQAKFKRKTDVIMFLLIFILSIMVVYLWRKNDGADTYKMKVVESQAHSGYYGYYVTVVGPENSTNFGETIYMTIPSHSAYGIDEGDVIQVSYEKISS